MVPNSSSDELPKSRLADARQLLRKEALELPADELHHASLTLADDDRLRLVVQLWKSLPAEHRSALLTLQMEDAARPENHPLMASSGAAKKPRAPSLVKKLFDPSHTSDLYSAPRRFDLATIFVVTAAYSLVLGGLTAMGWPPIVKVMVSILAAAIAVTQAMFKTTANPRGVSVVTGAAICTLCAWAGYVLLPVRGFPLSFPAVTIFLGLMGGSIVGYLVGTCVGGVFLVADLVRGKFEPRDVNNAGQPSAPSTEEAAERAWHE